jgi:tellurite methyltransferase
MNNNEIQYWKKFYNKKHVLENTSFSRFVLDYIQKFDKKFNILDIGCGNGRDSYYLSKYYNVTGIDSSNKPKEKENCKFILGDMIDIDKSKFDLIYSRFSFHSISDENQEKLLQSVKNDTLLFIETRSIKGLNTYREHGDGHYRNLTNINILKNMLEKNDFEILFVEEANNFAVYKTENPICIRIICKK